MKNKLYWFLFFVVLAANIYLRLFPAYFPQLKEQAKLNVQQEIWDEFSERVNLTQPDFNPYAKEAVVEELYNEKLRQKGIFKRQVQQEYSKLKDKYQDSSGQTYLLELDPYKWARYTENVLKNGHPGDKKLAGKSYDTRTLAPKGIKMFYVNFLYYCSAFLYKIFSFFFSGIFSQTFLFYLPLFYMAIFLTLVYFLAGNIFSPLAGLIAVSFVGFNRLFIQRSCVGWYDYDTLSLTAPLLVVWFILSALKHKDNLKKLVIFALLAAFSQGVFTLIWIGWRFIFMVMAVFFFCVILNNYFIDFRDLKKANKESGHYFICAAIFFVVSLIFVFLFTGMFPGESLLNFIENNLRLGQSVSSQIWPNTFYTVGELLPANMLKVAQYVYNPLIYVFSIVSMFLVYCLSRRGKNKDFFYIMFFWFAVMLFASFKGARFVLFLLPPLGLFLGGFFSEIMPRIVKKFSFDFRAKIAAKAGFLSLAVFVIVFFFFSGLAVAKKIYPFMDDNWHKALTYIKENTSAQAVIHSWWDYGDWFEAVAARGAIFDGQSQNKPHAYWMARVMMTKNEDEAVRILRMLNNASDETYTVLNKYIPDSFRSFALLDKLLFLDKQEGKKVLSQYDISQEDAKVILDGLYRVPTEAYFVVDGSMPDKIPSISFLGNWDFRKLYVYQHKEKQREEVVNNLARIFGGSLEAANSLYDEIIITPAGKGSFEAVSKRYAFYSPVSESQDKGKISYFDNGLVFDWNTEKGLIYSLVKRGYKTPKKIVISKGGIEKELVIDEGDFSKGVWIFEDAGKYKSMVLDEELINSLFSRLYFLKGRGLKFFEPFYMDDEAKIFVFKIKWAKLDE